jgi:DNA repair photolyase
MAKLDSLFPILQPFPAGPLARSAAAAPLFSEGHLTEYRPLPAKSIIGKTVSRRGLPFTHTINPYRGCEFGCRYCYARYTHEFLELRSPEEFEQKIFFKQNAAWLLEQELKKLKPGTNIALGTATDPYQPIERKQLVTRSLLEVFARTSGFRIGIISKSTLITRDLDLLEQVSERHALTVHTTVTTMNVKLARTLEPRAPRPDLRIDALAELRRAGIHAGVNCSPLMPGITDSRSSIAAVARAAAGARAEFFFAGALFLKPCSLPTFLGFVREHFPLQVESYRRRYEKSSFVSPEYRKRIGALVESVRREYGLDTRAGQSSWNPAPQPQTEMQPWLPFGG